MVDAQISEHKHIQIRTPRHAHLQNMHRITHTCTQQTLTQTNTRAKKQAYALINAYRLLWCRFGVGDSGAQSLRIIGGAHDLLHA